MQRNFFCSGAYRVLRPGKKSIKIFYTGPCRSFVVGVNVIPAKVRSEIHHTTSGIEALGSEIGTISADGFVVIVARVTSVSPAVGIGYCSDAVVEKRYYGQKNPPPFSLSYEIGGGTVLIRG